MIAPYGDPARTEVEDHQGLAEASYYHRAEYDATYSDPWRVQWTENGPVTLFTAAEGEAMGLTPPAPAPLVVTCNGHSIELSDEQAQRYIADNERYRRPWSISNLFVGLLRDARQDPQPASDDPSDDDELPFMSPRQHLEALLAGRDDAYELIECAARWGGNAFTEQGRWHSLIGDAARGGA
jgi:hypothetical protein